MKLQRQNLTEINHCTIIINNMLNATKYNSQTAKLANLHKHEFQQ